MLPGYGRVWRYFLNDRENYALKGMDVHLHAHEGDEITSNDDILEYEEYDT